MCRALVSIVLILAFAACSPEIIGDSLLGCKRDSDCPSGLCVVSGDDLYCADPCDDQDICDEGHVCTLARDADGRLQLACLAENPDGRAPGGTCQSAADCATYLCHEGLCVETCSSCSGGQACELVTLDYSGESVELPICQWRINWHTIELGSVSTPEEGSPEITFTIAPDVASLTIVLVDDDGLRVTITSLVAPDGTVLIDLEDSSADLNPAISFPGSIAALVPNTDDPAARVAPGTYRMRVGTFDPDNLEDLVLVAGHIERVLVLVEPVGEEGGLLDLSFHLAPGTLIEPETAATDPFMIDLLASLADIYAQQAAIRLGAVRYLAIPADHDVVDSSHEIRSMLATYAEPGPHSASVNVFLVTDITFTSGYSAGIPGPPGIYGIPAAGLVVEMLSSGSDTGVLVAHEIGHFLGLRHTTELDGGHDPILDTSECASGTPVAACPDYTNLMFPMFPLDRTLKLTAGQRMVLHHNPTLYEVNRPVACSTAAATTIDLTEQGLAAGNTSSMPAAFAGECGGEASPERWHLFRVQGEGSGILEVRIIGLDFAPLVYVRGGDCADPAAEVACQAADPATELLLQVDYDGEGAWFIAVDGRDGGGGTFVLEVEAIPEP